MESRQAQAYVTTLAPGTVNFRHRMISAVMNY
jgi:hypothetical protein